MFKVTELQVAAVRAAVSFASAHFPLVQEQRDPDFPSKAKTTLHSAWAVTSAQVLALHLLSVPKKQPLLLMQVSFTPPAEEQLLKGAQVVVHTQPWARTHLSFKVTAVKVEQASPFSSQAVLAAFSSQFFPCLDFAGQPDVPGL